MDAMGIECQGSTEIIPSDEQQVKKWPTWLEVIHLAVNYIYIRISHKKRLHKKINLNFDISKMGVVTKHLQVLGWSSKFPKPWIFNNQPLSLAKWNNISPT